VEFTNTFQLPGDPASVWPRFLDVESMAMCMPGAGVTRRDGEDAYDLRMQVALGPMRLTYHGDLTVVEADAAQRMLVLAADVKEARGGGRAQATVRTTLGEDAGAGTRVEVATELQISGRAAQMGRNVIDDVARRMTEQFATCLQSRMSASSQQGEADDGGGAVDTSAAAPRPVGGLRLLLAVLRDRVARMFRRA
jgi:carbon monoxide dehydrogenase subunit G